MRIVPILVWIAICLMSTGYANGQLRILAIFPLNGKSHHVLCDQLIKGLAAKGHYVDVYSHFPQKRPIPNIKDFNLDGSLPILTNNMSYEVAVSYQALNIRQVLDQVSNPMCELLGHPLFQNLINNPPKDPPYDLVITEAFVSNCQLIWGRFLNIPMVSVMTSGLFDHYNAPLGNPFNTAVTPSLGLTSPSGQMNFWQRLANTVMSQLFVQMFNYMIVEQDAYVEKYFGPGYPSVLEFPKDIDLLLVNSHQSLEGIRAYTPAIVPIAGIHIVDDNATLPDDVKKWLDESKDGCVYFSFGSMVRIETFPRRVLQVFYASFRKLAPVRVLLKIAKPEELPPGLPENVMTKSWFDQIQVLKHKNVKAFVTHGGLMSSLESLYCGVPMIGVPIFGDQHQTVHANVKRGIEVFVSLDTITEHSFTSAVQEILHNPSYAEKTTKLSKLFVDRPLKPMDTAIFWIEYISRHGKHALRSPIVDMPWWQVHLLDVYGFILLIFVLAYYLLKFFLIKILNICFPAKSIHLKSKKNR